MQRSLNTHSMPMGELFDFQLLEVTPRTVRGKATPTSSHENPFGVAQGGFAAAVLDIALGLVSVSTLEGDATHVATTDLSVRYMRAITASTGPLEVRARVLHRGRMPIVAEAQLTDETGRLYACAQANVVLSSTFAW